MSNDRQTFVPIELDNGENFVRESAADVEEVSCYLSTLNPLNLYKLGAVFYLGRLLLTTRRLILLPYNTSEVKRAKRFEKIAYELIDKCGLGIPTPEIQFYPWPLCITLEDVGALNPFRKLIGGHPSLCVYTEPAKYLFKFTSQDEPADWADTISELCGAPTADVLVNECVQCGRMGVQEGTSSCAACEAQQGPTAEEIWTGQWATNLLGQLAAVNGWKQKLRALTSPSGHTAECSQCHYLNHHRAVSCKYCHAELL